MEGSETWITEALKSFSISKSGMQGGEAKRNLPRSILDDSHVSNFWSTFWSPIYAFYMSFRRSGSKKSNASNGVWFGVEMKELQPLQADHSKLKEFLHGCEISLELRKCCPFAVKISQPFWTVACMAKEFLLKLPNICDRHFEIFCFRYLMSKSPNSPCNPPIIGFLSL